MADDAWSWLGTGGGDAAGVMRAVDWAATPVGPVEGWPSQLRSIIAMMLYARQPMFLWWGPELVQFYNDGYTPSFGVGRHPAAMGQRGKECWAEIWPIIGPEIEGVIARAEGTYHEDALVPIFRNGRMEEVYWTYGYSPVFDERGGVAGVLVVVTETTTRVLSLRRLTATRRLADSLALAQSHDEVAQRAVEALSSVQDDVCWALAVDSASGALLAHSENLSPAVAAQVAAQALASGDTGPLTVTGLALPGEGGAEASSQAVVLPLRTRRDAPLRGVLVAGLSPRLPFDLAYRQHMQDVARTLDEAAQRLSLWAERAAAERSRDDLLLQAPVAAALLVGPTWRYDLANQAYVELVGRDVVGRTWDDCFPELRGSQTEAILERVYSQGETIVSSEVLIPLARMSDGVVEERYFDFTMVPVRTRHGEVDAMMVVAVELTPQVRLRRDLERTAAEREDMLRELRAVSRSKDEFVAMLSHELRNPLAPINTALSLIAMRNVPGIDREREVIARQVSHLTRLVDDLLDVARLASDKVKLSLTVVDLADVVSQACELSEPVIEERAQRLHVQVARGFLVHADEARLTQVVANLLTNASKYSHPTSAITISAEARGAEVALVVRDEGVGIDADMLPRVFDLFSQERQSLARSAGGLGLGLAIVRNLVHMHGGSVSAQSDGRERGSTFTVLLPRSPDVTASPKPTTSRPPRSTEVRRVLIVDDNLDSAELLSELLHGLGHVTRVAGDGAEALAMVDEFQPDVAVLDIGLPVMDGYELARHLREGPHGARLRLFAVTGYGQEDDRRRAREAGFDAHFVKPIDLTTVIAALQG